MARRRRRRKRYIRDALTSVEQAGYEVSDSARLGRAVLQEFLDGVHVKLVRPKGAP